jgi:hypothetical protein
MVSRPARFLAHECSTANFQRDPQIGRRFVARAASPRYVRVKKSVSRNLPSTGVAMKIFSGLFTLFLCAYSFIAVGRAHSASALTKVTMTSGSASERDGVLYVAQDLA